MDFKDFIKTTEAIIVFSALFLTWAFGGFWAVVGALAYTVLNVKNLKDWFIRKK